MRTWLLTLRAELPLLRDLPDPEARPLPRIGVVLGPTVPGWVLRAATSLASGLLLLIATGRLAMDAGVAWTLVWICVAVIAVWPSPSMALVAVVASGLFLALDGHGPFDPVVLGLIPLAYASVRLGWWAQRVSWTARVEWAALARGLPRGLAFVGGTVAVGALVLPLAGQPLGPAVVAGGAALAVLAWLVMARRP